MARPPAAVLWDMDGTLVDTEPYWIDVEFELAERHGGTWSHEHALQAGRQRPARVRRATSASTWASTSTPEQIVEELLDGVVARVERAGARGGRAPSSCSPSCARAGVPCALVTMSYQRFVAPILAALPPGTFDVVVTGDAVDARQAAPGALPQGRRRCWASTPARLPGGRGLQHRRPVRRGRRLHGAGRAEPRAGRSTGSAASSADARWSDVRTCRPGLRRLPAGPVVVPSDNGGPDRRRARLVTSTDQGAP